MTNWLLAAGFIFPNYIVFVVFFFLQRLWSDSTLLAIGD